MDLPRRYGHYVLLERIAVGGMGEIFRASYGGIEGFERLCAIKRILPHLSDDEEFIDRLISEAKIAVQLTHVNVVQVYELGRIENEYFIAMEWVDGPDLATLLTKARAKEIPLPLSLAIHICHELARAISYAHRKTDAHGKPLGIIHRDISPQNIMVSQDGAVKLGDFGIARAGGIARKFATGMGAVLGKRRYMSPEQRRGEQCDGRTDIYALGALLTECVTGEAPDPETEREPLTKKVPDLPPELEALVSRALALDAKARIADAAELVDGLERIFMRLASQPGAVRDPALELGRYIRRVSPPGEKQPNRRSLTDRMRAAMGGRAPERPSNPSMEGTAAVTVPVDISILDDGPEGVTIVHSAVAPIAPRRAQATDAGDRRASGASEEWQAREAEGRPSDRATAVKPRAAETQVSMRPVIPTLPPTVDETVATSSDVRRSRAVVQVEPRTSSTELDPSQRGVAASRSNTGPMLLGAGAAMILLAAGILALREDPSIAQPTDTVVITTPPVRTPTPMRTATPTPVVVKTATPAPTPRRTPAPTPTPTRVAAVTARTPAPTPKPRGYGMISVGVEGVAWAWVSIDGKRQEKQAPLFDLKLKAGPHKIVVEHPTAGRREKTVMVEPNQSTTVILSFKAGR